MINTIFFDLVGVLLFPKANGERNDLIDAIDHRIGQVTNDARFKEEILHETNLGEEEFNKLLRSIVDKYEPTLPLWEMLPQLKKRYKLGIINNGTTLTYPLFEEKYPLSQEFDAFISSGKIGVCKPAHEIYLYACKKLGSPPQNCLFMDDSEENLVGAEEVGMQTILWPDRERGFHAFRNWTADLNTAI